MTANAELAERARCFADKAPRGSMARKTWLCVSVVLSTTASIPAARRALADIPQDDIRHAAGQLLRQLASEASP